MQEARTPTGITMQVPETVQEDGPSFRPGESRDAESYYREHGYVVVRNFFTTTACDRIRMAFDAEVRPFSGVIRRIGGQLEVNQFNENKHLVNPLMNVQDAADPQFSQYVESVLDVLTARDLQQFLAPLLGSAIRLMTYNHFEANPETSAHQDCYFWGGPGFGQVVGLWVALEDISASAGRLYVYPRTHLMKLESYANAVGFSGLPFSATDPAYQALLLDFLRASEYQCAAPCLHKGDALLWDSRTVHGSLKTTDAARSRSSFTAHYAAHPTRFVRGTAPDLQRNGMRVTRSHYNDPLMTVLRRKVRSAFPGLYATLRQLAGR